MVSVLMVNLHIDVYVPMVLREKIVQILLTFVLISHARTLETVQTFQVDTNVNVKINFMEKYVRVWLFRHY